METERQIERGAPIKPTFDERSALRSLPQTQRIRQANNRSDDSVRAESESEKRYAVATPLSGLFP
jgi:hypothetical protein